MKTIIFEAPGISCHHCERAITGAVSKLAGVAATKVDVPAKTVTVDYDAERISIDTIKQTIEDQGYDVTKQR